jgi:hypothetical protein
MKLTKSRVKALLIFCFISPIGWLGIQTEVSAGEALKPGCFYIGGYRYEMGSYRYENGIGHRERIQRWDPTYTQYCPEAQRKPNPSKTRRRATKKKR